MYSLLDDVITDNLAQIIHLETGTFHLKNSSVTSRDRQHAQCPDQVLDRFLLESPDLFPCKDRDPSIFRIHEAIAKCTYTQACFQEQRDSYAKPYDGKKRNKDYS